MRFNTMFYENLEQQFNYGIPKFAVVVCKPGKAFVVGYVVFKEHAEFLVEQYQGCLVSLEFGCGLIPFLPEAIKQTINRFNAMPAPTFLDAD